LSEVAAESPIRVYLMIENRLLREALGRLFRKRPDLQVAGQSDHNSFPESLDDLCDVLAVDHFDPERIPAPFSSEARTNCRFKTVLIGMSDDPAQFLQAVRAGVNGYLLKDASASDVISAIRATFRGEAVCPPKLCAALFEQYAQCVTEAPSRSTSRRADLTLRQRQLVNLVAKGLTNKEIALQLNLSEFTVRNHIHRIMKQVEVGSRQEAVKAVQGTSAIS
jgi:DNA-binding NarL/FixJ family response regulator